jgi:Carboxypeptidase regulatory-like domain
MVVVSTGCRRGAQVLDTGARPPVAEGTISGTVRGPERGATIEGRTVEVVSLETNERQRVTTNYGGGFTLKVKPGKYRVELTLRKGEALVKQPGIMNVSRSNIDAHADFVLGARESRPRGAGSRTNATLGAPIA